MLATSHSDRLGNRLRQLIGEGEGTADCFQGGGAALAAAQGGLLRPVPAWLLERVAI